VIADEQVENDRRGDDRYVRYLNVEALRPFFQVANDAPGGIQSECAATGEKNSMYFGHEVQGPESIDLPCSYCGASDVDSRNGTVFAEYDRAARDGFRVGGMAHFDSRDIRDGIVHAFYPCYWRGEGTQE
jgi:hypothetical protein